MSPHSATTIDRIEVCPPRRGEGPLRRVWTWLRTGQALRPQAEAQLDAVREDFRDCLLDLPREVRVDLVELARHARSLRELWHLRPAVFGAIARVHSQDEAQRRLARLNCHFPTRSPRSGFGPLDG